jgi:beta-galactosidase
MKNRIQALTFILLTFMLVFVVSCKQDKTRNTFSLSGNWNFSIDSTNMGIGAQWPEKGIPAAQAVSVTVPHTWNAMPGLEKYWGKAWYEKVFTMPASMNGRCVRLQFDAVYHDATIWMNGKKAGEHSGSGYTRFFIDVSDLVKPGKENRLVVLADNAPSRSSVPFLTSYDWANDGGIIRNVTLISTTRKAIACGLINGVPDPGGKNRGTAWITLSLLNQGSVDYSRAQFNALIREENQATRNTVWKGNLEGTIENGQFRSKLELDNIKWWHFDDPNLYSIEISLIDQGKAKDVYTSCFGFRSISFNRDRFILNGEPVRLIGLEWMPGSNLEKGMAEDTVSLAANLRLMKNVNCIYTRFHWQQDDFVFDWCDRHGILVQEEIPYWGWETLLNDTLLRIGKQQLDEMIASHFNHPSIIAWGIGNELNSHDRQNIAALQELYRYTKEIDSSRLVNYVSNQLNAGLKSKPGILPDASGNGDVMMFNEYYSTWYGKRIDAVPAALDQIHAEYPNKPLVISEWGICEPVHTGGDPRRVKEMIQQAGIYGSKEFVAGAIYFCLNDYRTHMGEDFTYSYPQRVHGVVDVHLNPKPSYFTLQELSIPFELVSIKYTNNKVNLTLKGKTTLPCYTIRNYTIRCGTSSLVLDKLKPGEIKTIEITAGSEHGKIQVLRPTGFLVKSIEF